MTVSHAQGLPFEPVRVGRYLLVEALGEGGMGRVDRARAFGAAGVTKEVCIKRIRQERLRHQGSVERFIREASLSMQLAHGNIVPVFDFGRAGDEYFLAMEWVDGADLGALIEAASERGETFAPEVVAHVGAEVGRALAYAHERTGPDGGRIVHGDVKPANVLVSRAGDVKLTDFGVATLMGADGPLGGTPSYMSPEQRKRQATDARADLYSLGVTLAEMLTGERGPARLEGSAASEELRACIRALLEEDLERRTASAREAASDLERVVARARADGAPSPRERLAEWAERAAAARRRRHRRQRLELGLDTSYRRDGETADFSARMGATTVTGSEGPPPPIAPPPSVHAGAPPGRSRRRTLGLWAAGLSILLAASLLAVVHRTPPGPAEAPSEPRPAGQASARTTPAPGEPGAARGPAATAAPALPSADRSSSILPADPPSPSPAALEERPGRPPSGEAADPRRTAPARVAVHRRPAAAPAPEPGRLNVNAIPWAEVHIDGRAAGVTPLFGVELAPGTHTVRFVNAPLGAEHETSVTLEAGARRDLVVDLQ